MKRVTRYSPIITEHQADMTEDENGEWVKWEDVPSWAMLMDILDAVYPASIFTGESGDSGPGIIKKLREIDAIRNGKTGGERSDG